MSLKFEVSRSQHKQTRSIHLVRHFYLVLVALKQRRGTIDLIEMFYRGSGVVDFPSLLCVRCNQMIRVATLKLVCFRHQHREISDTVMARTFGNIPTYDAILLVA